MLPSASNRYSVLSEEVSGSGDLRIEMEDLQATNLKTEQAQRNDVSSVLAGQSMPCLTAPAFIGRLTEGQ